MLKIPIFIPLTADLDLCRHNSHQLIVYLVKESNTLIYLRRVVLTPVYLHVQLIIMDN